MANKKTGRKIVLFILVAAAVAGGVWYSKYRKREIPITVQTEKAARRGLTEVVVATGKIQPVTFVKISPEVSGEIIELPVKEGQLVKKGDLLLKIKPDFYTANRNQSEASYQASRASRENAVANLAKAAAEMKRNQELFKDKLISESLYLEFTTTYEVAKSTLDSATHQVDVAKAGLNQAEDSLKKTTIYSPLDGTISQLNSHLGERVVGTATMAGTDVMTISDLNEMEAWVDLGEIDVVLIKTGQKAQLDVDSYRDRKFNGIVTDIANSAKSALSGAGGGGGGGSQTDATKFLVKVRITEKEPFRPGMSVTANIETRYRTNVVTVPIQSVTTRLPKGTNNVMMGMKPGDMPPPTTAKPRKMDEANKPMEVVFVANGESAKMVPVKRGISDDNYVEITDGIQDGQEVISGGYKAINRELEEGKKIKVDNAPKPLKDDLKTP